MKESITYSPQGVCCQEMYIEIEDGHILFANFQGGCAGNLSGIAALIKGMKEEDVIRKLASIRCGSKATSCPAQLALALQKAPRKKI